MSSDKDGSMVEETVSIFAIPTGVCGACNVRVPLWGGASN